jgi:predicted N-acetyltransferase YhbS
VPGDALVAGLGLHVMGRVMVDAVTLRDGEVDRPILGRAPLAVAPELQGSGIGSALARGRRLRVRCLCAYDQSRRGTVVSPPAFAEVT